MIELDVEWVVLILECAENLSCERKWTVCSSGEFKFDGSLEMRQPP